MSARMGMAAVVALALMTRPALAQGKTTALDAAERELGAVTSLQYTGSGSSYFVGQPPSPGAGWLHYALTKYVADVDYGQAAMRQVLDRVQDDGGAPFGGPHAVWVVRGADAWNSAGNTASPQFRDPGGMRVAELRALEIWLTPHGFLKAARANQARVKRAGSTTVVTFTTPDRHTVTGVLDAQHRVQRTETTIDNPVTGDTRVVMQFDRYQRFGDVLFPTAISETVGGLPALELTVTGVTPNGAAAIEAAPANAATAGPSTTVKAEKLGDGVWYLTGGSHHSLLVEFADHLVVLEAPQDEARTTAVLTQIRALSPKPVRYVVNTHSHFDHLGGVRAYAAEGATLLAPAAARAFAAEALNQPHRLMPDRLARSGKRVTVEGIDGQRVLTDGHQVLELHVVPMSHGGTMLLPYLPQLKLLVQADLTVAPAGSGPTVANPVAVELRRHIEARHLAVERIAGIHGRITSWADLLAVTGR